MKILCRFLLAILCWHAGHSVAEACRRPSSLEDLLNAVQLVKNQSGLRAVVEHCYERHANSDMVQNGSMKHQARFWWEYLDAAWATGQHTKAALIGERFLEFFLALDAATRRSLLAADRQRPVNGLFTRLSALERHDRRDDILAQLEALVDEPAFFSPRILETWERNLRLSIVGFRQLKVSDGQVVRAIKANGEHRVRWEAYRDAVSRLREIPHMRVEAARRLTQLASLGL